MSETDASEVGVEPYGAGRVVVHGRDGAETWARLGAPERGWSGALTVEVVVDGWRFELEVEDAGRAELRQRATRAREADTASGPTEIRAIIPGRVAAVRVTAGDAVEAGASLLVVEAMKMQNELRAPRDGIVERVVIGEGETIENGDLLVVLR
ncbi:MAG TPA: biotin/lipoyl-containing protein [Candidatus Limnocylindrales bacterium]|nr:biotin/lipoyl-containing protein [Candidatus Limnocylindrales bacterium]